MRLVNDIDRFDIGISVSTGGLAVTGMLISAPRYFSLLAAQLETVGNPISAAMATAYNEVSLGQQLPNSLVVEFGPFYLHMRDAVTRSGSFEWRAPLWRVRLLAIDGWSVGNWAEMPEPDY